MAADAGQRFRFDYLRHEHPVDIQSQRLKMQRAAADVQEIMRGDERGRQCRHIIRTGRRRGGDAENHWMRSVFELIVDLKALYFQPAVMITVAFPYSPVTLQTHEPCPDNLQLHIVSANGLQRPSAHAVRRAPPDANLLRPQ